MLLRNQLAFCRVTFAHTLTHLAACVTLSYGSFQVVESSDFFFCILTTVANLPSCEVGTARVTRYLNLVRFKFLHEA